MAGYQKCDILGKGVQIGHTVSHAQNRSRKVWKPNLHPKRVWNGEKYIRMRLSTKAIRMVKAMRLTPETRREDYAPNARYQELEKYFMPRKNQLIKQIFASK